MFGTTAKIYDHSTYTQLVRKKEFVFFYHKRKEKIPHLSTKLNYIKPSNYLNFTFGIISPWSCVDIESMNTFFSDLENEYRPLGTNS